MFEFVGKKHEKKRQSMHKSSSLEEISQRNIDDLTESSESERIVGLRKPRLGSNDEAGARERRSWGDQVKQSLKFYFKSSFLPFLIETSYMLQIYCAVERHSVP